MHTTSASDFARRRSRRWRVVMWLALAWVLGCAVLWFTSFTWLIGGIANKYHATAFTGSIFLGKLGKFEAMDNLEASLKPGPTYAVNTLDWPHPFQWDFMPSVFDDSIIVPISLMAMPGVPLFVIAFLRARGWHRRTGHCPCCAYNRTGLPPTSLCPECGAPAVASAPVPSPNA